MVGYLASTEVVNVVSGMLMMGSIPLNRTVYHRLFVPRLRRVDSTNQKRTACLFFLIAMASVGLFTLELSALNDIGVSYIEKAVRSLFFGLVFFTGMLQSMFILKRMKRRGAVAKS